MQKIPLEILQAYALAAELEILPLGSGNINLTYLVKGSTASPRAYVLQRVNPIFKPNIHVDIAYISDHLWHKGILTTRLHKNQQGLLYTLDQQGGVWRLLTYIPGEVYDQPTSAPWCYAAGKFIGLLHVALQDLRDSAGGPYVFVADKRRAHDTCKHLQYFQEVLLSHRQHQAYNEVAHLAQPIFNYLPPLEVLENLFNLPRKTIGHGDLKWSNLVFTGKDIVGKDVSDKDKQIIGAEIVGTEIVGAEIRAKAKAKDKDKDKDVIGKDIAIIDLDTFNYVNLAIELADTWRSWCNPAGEGSLESKFSLEFLEAALKGYRETSVKLLTSAEVSILPTALLVIMLELSMRFAADALVEQYFAWDKNKYPTASAHNLVRAQSQFQLAESFLAQEKVIKQLLQDILLPGR